MAASFKAGKTKDSDNIVVEKKGKQFKDVKGLFLMGGKWKQTKFSSIERSWINFLIHITEYHATV